MTATAALAKHLLEGKKVSIMDGFHLFSMTNIPREVSRQIEDKFGVELNRKSKDFISDYGHKGTYFEYTLKKTRENKPGIQKMKEYVSSQNNRNKK